MYGNIIYLSFLNILHYLESSLFKQDAACHCIVKILSQRQTLRYSVMHIMYRETGGPPVVGEG